MKKFVTGSDKSKKHEDYVRLLDLDIESHAETVIAREDKVLQSLLPEIKLIEDHGIEVFTRAILLAANPNFWTHSPHMQKAGETRPALDETKPYGNVLYLKRLIRVMRVLFDSYELRRKVRDMLVSAALIHNTTRFDSENNNGLRVAPFTVVDLVRETQERETESATDDQSTTQYIGHEELVRILRIVRCQDGPWSLVPEARPSKVDERLLHNAIRICNHMSYIIDGRHDLSERWEVERKEF